ncbi:type IV pilus twitching motility protein PilT [Acidobacteria bacterium AH-259-D05]|nr:type IV pilus twitching motility protein PilT [Acidobacteria bacterium AH-259-D05]
MNITELLTFAVREGASDLHLSSGEPPILRVHGDMKKLDHPPLTNEEVNRMINAIMTDKQRQDFEEFNELDFSFELDDTVRFRINVLLELGGKGAVFRTIPNQILTLEELGLPPILRHLCERKKGLILLTGPTGTGKSTSLAAMINHINNTKEVHILTIEDPIEFVHKSNKCLIRQRELGRHTLSFANALRAALREDPDVILVGEMRDLETIQLAVTAAETGHLVLGTLHSPSAPLTVGRIIDVFPPGQQAQIRTQLADSLQAIITQTLCKKIGGGRVPALEILVGTPPVRHLIREGKVHQLPSAMETGKKDRMQTMDAALTHLVESGLITKEEAQIKSSNPNLFRPTPARTMAR